MKKLISLAAIMVLFVVLCGHTPAGAFREKGIIYLAQQTGDSADKQSGTAMDEVSDEAAIDDEDEYDDDEYADEEEVELIPDPLIEINAAFYQFNDKMYFWLLKPVARVYGFIIPEEFRSVIRNVFYNIRFPGRFINCLLQGKGRKAGAEFTSFFLNSTIGILGMANAASHWPHLDPSPEDFGQTFAVWGVGSGAYLMLPVFGPSSFRDGLGLIGDALTDPIFWATRNEEFWVPLAIRAGETVNATSLRIGEYEALKEAAIDPYVMIRNAWVQNRIKLIAE